MPEERTLGTAIYVHSKLTYDKIVTRSNYLQASIIKLYLPDKKNITICNIYNQPAFKYDLGQLSNLLSNLQAPLLIVGDFNAHHHIWDTTIEEENQAGLCIEQLINDNNLCCLNDENTPTYFSKSYGTFSSIDLSLCTLDLIEKLEWNVV